MRAPSALLALMVLAFVPALAEDDPAPLPPPPEQRIEELEQKVKVLERKAEVEKEAAAEKAKATATATAGSGGFFLKSADGFYTLRIRGYIQLDGRFFNNQGMAPAIDTFEIRRFRTILEATLGERLAMRLIPDFGEGKTVIQDAHLDVRLAKPVLLRGGKMKSPVGLERLQSDSDTSLVELGPTSSLTPNRDVGVLFLGELEPAKLSWSAGVFNGVVDGSSGDLDSNDSKDLVARLMVEPVKGLGFGFAASAGTQVGTRSAPALPSFKTFAQQTFFAYLSDGTAEGTVVANGDRIRVAPQAYLFRGRFGAMGEWVRSSQDVARAAATDELVHEAWQVQASWILFGDGTISYKGVAPRGKMGAWELTGRYGRLTVDDDAFPTFADPARQARESTETAIGLNWWVNRNLKVMASAVRTTFDGGATMAGGGDRPDEDALFLRLQGIF